MGAESCDPVIVTRWLPFRNKQTFGIRCGGIRPGAGLA